MSDDTNLKISRDHYSHPTSLFRSLAILGLCGHSLILIAMVFAGIRPLVMINIVSVTIYGLAIALNSRRWFVAVLAIGLIEVMVHAVIATSLLGWASGFHIYMLALVPLVFFFEPWSLRVRVVMSLLIAILYVALAAVASRWFIDDTRGFISWFRYGNLLAGAMVLSALSYYYGTAVRRVQDDLERKNAELEKLSRTDPLTGLANRREALHLIDWERIRNTRAGSEFAVALIDIDYFKKVNDEHGHDRGDLALIGVAAALTGSLRAQDRVARWGGEEFLLVLPQTGMAGAKVAAERARRAVESLIPSPGGVPTALTVTIGVAIFGPGMDIDAVLKRADLALYEGKESGRNRVEFG